jgi:hypothetical protein
MYCGKTKFNTPRGQRALLSPAWYPCPLNPTVPLAPRTVASSGQEQIHRSPLSLNAPSTSPESPLSRAWNIPPCSAAAAEPHYLAPNLHRPSPPELCRPSTPPAPPYLRPLKGAPKPAKRLAPPPSTSQTSSPSPSPSQWPRSSTPELPGHGGAPPFPTTSRDAVGPGRPRRTTAAALHPRRRSPPPPVSSPSPAVSQALSLSLSRPYRPRKKTLGRRIRF